jgi:hypothetical protein
MPVCIVSRRGSTLFQPRVGGQLLFLQLLQYNQYLLFGIQKAPPVCSYYTETGIKTQAKYEVHRQTAAPVDYAVGEVLI